MLLLAQAYRRLKRSRLCLRNTRKVQETLRGTTGGSTDAEGQAYEDAKVAVGKLPFEDRLDDIERGLNAVLKK